LFLWTLGLVIINSSDSNKLDTATYGKYLGGGAEAPLQNFTMSKVESFSQGSSTVCRKDKVQKLIKTGSYTSE